MVLQLGKTLSAYAHHPKKVQFENQEKGEEILLLLRRHIITTLSWVVTAIVLILLPLFLPAMFHFLQFFPDLAVPSEIQVMLVVVWYLLTMGFILENFLIWYYNVYLVTNKRVVDVDFHGVMYKSISEAPLTRVQDVTYNMGGFLQVIFNFGEVIIQTAGEQQFLEFEMVPHPDKVVSKIGEIIQLEKLHWKKEKKGEHE